MNNTTKKQNITFLLLTVAIIFFSPWFYKFIFTAFGGKVHELSYVVVALSAILIGVLYVKLNAKLWLLLICLILLPAIAWELKSFISFEIACANNEVHIEPCDYMPEGEMYRDFASYYDFAYGNEYWNGLARLLKREIIWLITPFIYLFLSKTFSKKNHPHDIIDQKEY